MAFKYADLALEMSYNRRHITHHIHLLARDSTGFSPCCSAYYLRRHCCTCCAMFAALQLYFLLLQGSVFSHEHMMSFRVSSGVSGVPTSNVIMTNEPDAGSVIQSCQEGLRGGAF